MLVRPVTVATALLATFCVLPAVASAAPPVAQDDAVSALSGETYLDVLANDSDPDSDPLSISDVSNPAHGTVDIVTTPDGPRIRYVVNPDGGGTDFFTYTADDGQGGTATATVTVTIFQCPFLGEAIDDGGLLAGQSWLACSAVDANADDGSATSLLPVTDGSQALLTTGNAALAAPPDDSAAAGRSNGTALRGAFDVSVLRLELDVPALTDCLGFDLVFASEEYPFFVAEINDGFVAELDSSDWIVTGDAITAPNNFAFDGAGKIVSVKSAFFDPGRVVEANGTEYNGSTPRLEVRTPVTPGSHSIYFSVFDASDDILDSAAFVDNLHAFDAPAGTCQAGANEAPTAADDAVTTDEDTPVGVALGGLDPDGDPPTHSITAGPGHGTVSGTGANRTYTPDANFHGTDSFSYLVSDGRGGTDTATVTLTVDPVNDAPVAADGSATVDVDAGTVLTLAATDVDGDTLSYTVLAGPAHGSLSGTGSTPTYTPDPGYEGPDSFTFSANDGVTDSNVATMSITVEDINAAPVASSSTVLTDEGTPKDITLSATDADGDPLTFSVVTGPSHGTLSGSGASRTYTPDAGYHGADSFTFTANDGNADSNVATVSISVVSVNDLPVASDDSVTTDEDVAKAIMLAASDADGDALTFTILSGPEHGSLSGSGSSRTYTPAANYHGPDSFTFRVNDGQADSNVATVSISVSSVNDAPTASDGSVSTDVDTAVDFTLVAGDVDGDALSYTVVTGPAHGSLSGAGPDPTYTPDAGYTGSDSLTFRVNDGQADSNVGTVSLDVHAVPAITINDPDAPEGTSGTRPLTFTVTLSAPVGRTVTVDYATQDGSALAASDYVADAGTVTFSPGDTSEAVVVSVVGDLVAEPNELLTLGLSAAANATISPGAEGIGTGTIQNDDECTVVGTAGPDTLTGTNGPDVLCGLGGNDTLRGRGGNDRLVGAAGNDVLEPGSGADQVDGGLGTDVLSYVGSTRAAVVDLASGVATAEGTDALVGVENVTGSRLADRLRGSVAANELSGGAGVDSLLGRAGNDRLVGGAARNDLDGGPGRDVCLGANGGVRRGCEA